MFWYNVVYVTGISTLGLWSFVHQLVNRWSATCNSHESHKEFPHVYLPRTPVGDGDGPWRLAGGFGGPGGAKESNNQQVQLQMGFIYCDGRNTLTLKFQGFSSHEHHGFRKHNNHWLVLQAQQPLADAVSMTTIGWCCKHNNHWFTLGTWQPLALLTQVLPATTLSPCWGQWRWPIL